MSTGNVFLGRRKLVGIRVRRRVGNKRVQPVHDLPLVWQPIPVRIGQHDTRARLVLLHVKKSISIRVRIGVRRAIRVKPDHQLYIVRYAVLIRIRHNGTRAPHVFVVVHQPIAIFIHRHII